MKKKQCVLNLLITFAAIFLLNLPSSARTTVEGLRTEYLAEPLGIDASLPRFTWTVSAEGAFTQEKYRVSVAASPELLKKGDLIWTSGIVTGSGMRVVYGGPALEPHTRYYWRVEVWEHGKRTVSEPAWFETAKMSPDDWRGVWITDEFTKEFRKSPMVRKEFHLSRRIKSARAYVCGVGYYELFLNGQRVGERMLDPGYTHFDKRVLYSTYDVTDLLCGGGNAVAAVIGNGWFNVQSLAVWDFDLARWRMRPRLLCDIRVEYDDGTSEIIATDASWKTNTGPYVFNNIYSGDIYDARLEKDGWTLPQYDDSEWQPVTPCEAPAPIVAAQQMPPIRVTEETKPVGMKVFPGNIRVFDMGRNMSGFCRLRVSGEPGTRITVKHGELVTPEGRLDQGNVDVYFQREDNHKPQHLDPMEIFQTDTYYLKGGETEIWQPSFCYHGFRYVEVESDKPLELGPECITALFVHTDVEPAGSFRCSDEILNKLHQATCRTYLSNLHSIPTDCPQREKNGWTADGYISLDLALLNYDGITVYEKWMNDFADNQRAKGDIAGIIPTDRWGYTDWIGPVWDAGMFVTPYKLYLYYGETRAVEKLWPTCVKYLDYLSTRETDEGILTYGLGDWVFYKARTDSHFTSTAFYWLDNVLMARFATLLGKDPQPYEAKAEALKRKIVEKWYDPSGGLWANGTQAAQAVALALGLVPEGEEQKVADRLADMIRANGHHLDFGMLGSKTVPMMLTRYGYVEDAYRMITNPEAPSWADWIYKGLTTLPETWVMAEDFKDASLNHSFLGDVAAWMIKAIAGIDYDPAAPGFSHIVFRPHFIEGLDWAEGEYRSVKGYIRSSWKRKDGKIELEVTVPANTTATLYLDREIGLASGTHNFTL